MGYNAIFIITRNPQHPILIIKAPTSLPESSGCEDRRAAKRVAIPARSPGTPRDPGELGFRVWGLGFRVQVRVFGFRV